MTIGDELPASVRKLIAERLDSVTELEAVLLLRQSSPKEWSPEEAGQRLYVSTTVARHVLAALHRRGLVSPRGEGFVYAPESAELAGAVEQLAASYSEHLILVTNLIHQKPSAAVRAFAQAFRIRKDG